MLYIINILKLNLFAFDGVFMGKHPTPHIYNLSFLLFFYVSQYCIYLYILVFICFSPTLHQDCLEKNFFCDKV